MEHGLLHATHSSCWWWCCCGSALLVVAAEVLLLLAVFQQGLELSQIKQGLESRAREHEHEHSSMSTRCTRVRARAFEHKRDVGRQSVRAVSRILNDMRNWSDIFVTCTWVCMGLDGSTCSEYLPVVTCDFEPPEHVPWTSVRAHTCAMVFGRATCVPRSREHEKRHAAGRKKMTMCKNNTFIHDNIYTAAG